MIHGDPSSGAKKEAGEGGRRSRSATDHLVRLSRFSKHAFLRLAPRFSSFMGDTIRRLREREREREKKKKNITAVKARHVRPLPVHVVLQLHLYWTVPRRLILVVVFILRYLCKKVEETKDETMKIVCYIRVWQIGEISRGKRRLPPPSFLPSSFFAEM